MKSRPAETGGVAAAVVVLIAYLLGINDPAVIAALTVVVGFIPAAITWVVVLLRHKHPEVDTTTFGSKAPKTHPRK